ncbi:sulfurtransferase [Nakamurella silvestris]|nr:sulfurtransferase [Nakamurella silvestris]
MGGSNPGTLDDRPTVLVEATDLAEEMLGHAVPVVLDIRWSLSGSDREGYRAGHVPGALFVDLDAELADPVGDGSLGRHPLPGATALQALWRRVGIRPTDTVVVYDANNASAAARAWWLLRWSGIPARVLNGGLAAWEAAGLRTIPGDGTPLVPGSVTVVGDRLPTVDPEAAAALASDPATVLLDARAAARYRGEVEPIDPKAGHIPGAANLPFTDLLEPDGRFRPEAELREAFAAAGIVPGVTAGASCGSGVTACHLILAAASVGLPLALYPGSFSQWCALDREIATG